VLDEFCGCFGDIKERRQLYGSKIVDLVSLLVLIDVKQKVRIPLCLAFDYSLTIKLFDNTFQIVH